MFIEPVFWNWLILACFLVALELLCPSFFLIFWEGAASLMAVITAVLPTISWQWQLLVFTILSLVVLLLWWFIVREWQKDENDVACKLNNRGKNLLGRQFVLQTPIEQGFGRLQIDDSLWTVRGEDMPAGTLIVIEKVESLELGVKRVQ